MGGADQLETMLPVVGHHLRAPAFEGDRDAKASRCVSGLARAPPPAGRLLLDHGQRVEAEVGDDAFGEHRADAFDQPRAEVALDAWIVAGNTVVYDSTSNCRPYCGCDDQRPISRRLSPGYAPNSAPTTVSRLLPRGVATRATVYPVPH